MSRLRPTATENLIGSSPSTGTHDPAAVYALLTDIGIHGDADEIILAHGGFVEMQLNTKGWHKGLPQIQDLFPLRHMWDNW